MDELKEKKSLFDKKWLAYGTGVGLIIFLIIFGINNPAIYYNTNLPDHPYATWQNVQIKNMNCPDDQIWYSGYMSGCVPKSLIDESRASEGYLINNPTIFDENGINIEKVEKN